MQNGAAAFSYGVTSPTLVSQASSLPATAYRISARAPSRRRRDRRWVVLQQHASLPTDHIVGHGVPVVGGIADGRARRPTDSGVAANLRASADSTPI